MGMRPSVVLLSIGVEFDRINSEKYNDENEMLDESRSVKERVTSRGAAGQMKRKTEGTISAHGSLSR